jgi:restriction endonuclease S subunit
LEGLEVAVKSLQIVKTQQLRLEAQYHTAITSNMTDYYLGEEVIQSANYNSIYGINSDGDGYLVLRMHEFDGIFAGVPTAYSKNFGTEDFEQHRLRKDDILICRTNGNPKLIGKSALVAKDYDYVYESHLFKVRPDESRINSSTLTVFLNSIYGRMDIEKLAMQGNQSNFSLAKFKELRIPKFSKLFQNSLNRVVYESFSLKESSALNILQAETLLLAALGIKNFAQNSDSINIKSFKDSLANTGRLDAEYYQPKYENLLRTLGKDGLTIADVAPVRSEKFLKSSGTDFHYLEIGGLRGDGSVASETVACDDAPSRASQRVRKGDIITSTVRPIRRLSALVSSAQDGYVCSSGFVVLQPKQIAAEVLLVYLRLPVICELMDLHTSASLYPAISEKDLLGLPIPVIPKDTQKKIAAFVQRSFTLKTQSECLLEAAKRAVEIAIEQDEAAGMAYLARENSTE